MVIAPLIVLVWSHLSVQNLGGTTSKQHTPFLMVPLGCSSSCVGGDAPPKVVMDGDAHMCGDAHLGGRERIYVQQPAT